MGLKCTPYGAKATLKARYPQCFREVTSLTDARRLVGLVRGSTVIALDGNVQIMQVPQIIRPLEGYVSVMFSSITSAMAAAAVVVVVFDEPGAPARARPPARARAHARACPQPASAGPSRRSRLVATRRARRARRRCRRTSWTLFL